jgi:hypothetical protein
MSKQEIELTAYCGLYCGDCIRYRSKAADLARDLLSELQNEGWDKYAEISSDEAFKNYEHCREALNAVARRKCDDACRPGGGCVAFSCRIVDCCLKRGFEGCWQCDEFENCREFEFLKPLHGDTPALNLRKIRELGLDKWAEHRHKCYVWQ